VAEPWPVTTGGVQEHISIISGIHFKSNGSNVELKPIVFGPSSQSSYEIDIVIWLFKSKSVCTVYFWQVLQPGFDSKLNASETVIAVTTWKYSMSDGYL